MGVIITLILVLDQVIKIWVKTTFDHTPVNVFGQWFRMVYVENSGMAFGTTFGSGIWPKLTLSILRIAVIIAIFIYLYRKIKEGVKIEFIVVSSIILAGAIGNLLDSMFYDYLFTFDPCYYYNFQPGSGIFYNCDFIGQVELRPKGFLLGNVVDMFQFNVAWPKWVPVLGGSDIFPAVWNISDACISIGVIWIFLRYKSLMQSSFKGK